MSDMSVPLRILALIGGMIFYNLLCFIRYYFLDTGASSKKSQKITWTISNLIVFIALIYIMFFSTTKCPRLFKPPR